MENRLKMIAIGVGKTCSASDNSDSEANIRAVIVSSTYADFVPSHLDNQVDLDSENWPNLTKPCGRLTQGRLQLHGFLRGNFGAKP